MRAQSQLCPCLLGGAYDERERQPLLLPHPSPPMDDARAGRTCRTGPSFTSVEELAHTSSATTLGKVGPVTFWEAM